MKFEKGFTLIELLVVIGVIGILGSGILILIKSAYLKAYQAKSKAELKSIAQAIHLYMTDNNFNYPADVSRDLPSGLEEYLSSKPNWPKAPWPDSVFDWDYWDSNADNPDAGTLSFPPTGRVYQISVRFCPLNNPSACHFPEEEWASNFDYYSSAYWCLEGSCRAHGSMPFDHPGCCLGGNCPAGAERCE